MFPWNKKPIVYTATKSQFNDPDQRNIWNFLAAKYRNLSTHVEKGTTRMCFIGNDYVYKLPLNQQCLMENRYEVRACEEKRFPIAECSIVEDHYGITVLRMERVLIVPEKNVTRAMVEENPWLSGLQDGYQVGWDKNGNLVLYDAGNVG
jgi:hypothetical protein